VPLKATSRRVSLVEEVMPMASSYRGMKAITLFKKKEVLMNTARL
jgi:hypothetical protein